MSKWLKFGVSYCCRAKMLRIWSLSDRSFWSFFLIDFWSLLIRTIGIRSSIIELESSWVNLAPNMHQTCAATTRSNDRNKFDGLILWRKKKSSAVCWPHSTHSTLSRWPSNINLAPNMCNTGRQLAGSCWGYLGDEFNIQLRTSRWIEERWYDYSDEG